MGRTKSDLRHACSVCDKSFTRTDHLARHALNHTTQAAYNCSVEGCGRSFNRQDLLNRHLLRHTKVSSIPGLEAGRLPPSRHASRRTSTAGAQVGAGVRRSASPERQSTTADLAVGMQDTLTFPYQSSFLQSATPSEFESFPQPPIASTSTLSPTPLHAQAPIFSLHNNDASTFMVSSLPTQLSSSFSTTMVPLPDWSGGVDASSTALFSSDLSLYDLTYDLNPTAGDAAETYDWLFNQFSPSTGLVHDEFVGTSKMDFWAQPPPVTSSPSSPEDQSAGLTYSSYELLCRLLSPVVVGPEHHAFSHASFQTNYAAYFARFNSQLPILHLPLFDVTTTAPHLLLAILCIGAFFSPDAEVCSRWQGVATKLKGLVVMSDEFVDPDAGIELLQTLILLEMHGKMMSNRPGHTMSSIMHSAYVNIARRTKIFLPKATPASDPTSPDSVWRAAMLDETGRRCAYALFLMDSAHAAIFQHSAVLSAFELRLDLPIPDNEWGARDGTKWHSLRFAPSRRPPPPFAEALKASLMPGGVATASSAFATSVLLHGLVSICHDISRRDNVLLGIDNGDRGSGKWKTVLAKALDSYKSRLEASCSARFGPQLLWSCLSLQCVAHIGLVSDLFDLQVFARAPAIFGQPIGRLAYEKAGNSICDWVQRKYAAEATWHAVIFLRSFILRRLEGGNDERKPGCVSDLPHLSWCLYIAGLVCWSFGWAAAKVPFDTFHSTSLTPATIPSSMLQSEWYFSEALAYCDAMSFRTPGELDEADERMKMHTSGLLVFILMEISDTRWELEREAGRLLTRLLTSRNNG